METDPLTAPALAGQPESAKQSWLRAVRARIAGLNSRHEKYSGIAIFSLGFLWDSLTLRRVDNLVDNIILLFYLLATGIMIFFTLRHRSGRALPGWTRKIEPHFLWAMQFCFGGLFSSYVIYYFKSASWTRTQFFFLILIILWIANEFLKQRMHNPELLSILYCFCLFTFLAFFLPVVMAKVDAWIFVLAGLISLMVSLSLFFLGLKTENGKWHPRTKAVAVGICATFLIINLLYFTNLIPPVPLALKSAGIYHQVTRTPSGYEVKYVSPALLRFWQKWDDPFYWSEGENVYCFTAIFAPGKVRVPVRHIWSHKTSNGWVQTDRIRFQIAGGREGGYRGFTKKHGIFPGKWRVEVETESGRILGRIDFMVKAGPTPHPPLETRVFH
jgi:hypothetical protein